LTIGDGKKKVRENEKNTIIVQRRAIRAKSNIPKGAIINQDDLIVLRPCPPDALPPYRMEEIIGKKSLNDIKEGDYVRLADLS
jgi:sialic acid synthase SpsE